MKYLKCLTSILEPLGNYLKEPKSLLDKIFIFPIILYVRSIIRS